MRSALDGGSLPGAKQGWNRGYTREIKHVSPVIVEVTTLCMMAVQEDWVERAGEDGLGANQFDIALWANRCVNGIVGANREPGLPHPNASKECGGTSLKDTHIVGGGGTTKTGTVKV
jgi:hypothetical protein